MREEVFELKSYFKTMNLSQAGMMFSLQVKTTRKIKYHRMNDKKFASELWLCNENTCNNKIESIFHIATNCKKYEHLRRDKAILENDELLVNFFIQVIQSRDEAQNE